MDLSGLLHGLLEDPAFARAARAEGPHGAVLTPDAAMPFLAAGMARHRLVLAVTATTRQAEDLAAAASSLTGPGRVAVMPAWETLPHERLSPSSDTVGRRLAILRRLAHPDDDDEMTGALDLVVAPIRALLQPIVRGLGDLQPVVVRPGDEIAHDDVAEALVTIGYTATDLVEKRGQFAIRGGILDVFPPTEEHPLRVEFWGDDVEEIRYFRVSDQRSLEVAGHGLWAPPCRELLLTQEVRARAAALARQHPELVEMCAKLAEGIAVEGMEALAPVLAEGMETTCRRARARRLPGRRAATGAAQRPGAGPDPCARPRGHQQRVPRRLLAQRRGRQCNPDRPRRGHLPHDRAGARRGRRPRGGLVDRRTVRPGSTRRATPTPTLRTPTTDRRRPDR